MQGRLVIATILGVALFMVTLMFGQGLASARSLRIQQNVTPSPKVIITPTTDIAVASITFEQMLDVYKEVLESTTRAIDDIHETAKIVLTIAGIIFSTLGIGGIGGAWWLRRGVAKAEKALRRAAQATELVKGVEEKTRNLEEIHRDLVQSLDKAHSELKDLGSDLEQWKRYIEVDRMAYKKSLELIQIDEHEMILFSGDDEKKWKSKMALIEMSWRPDPLIRKRCARTLGSLEEYDETVARRLEELAESDPNHGVKHEAGEALERLKGRKKLHS